MLPVASLWLILQRRVAAPWLAGHEELSAALDGTPLGTGWSNIEGKDPVASWAGIAILEETLKENRGCLQTARSRVVLEPPVTRDAGGSSISGRARKSPIWGITQGGRAR